VAPESGPAGRTQVAELSGWSIAVESWDAGELQVITEDRGLGYVTREVRPATAVTRLDAGTGDLRAWRDLPAVGPEISGVGEYVTTLRFDAPAEPGARYLLDLGSTAGGLGSVRINDGAAMGFDTSRPVVDVTGHLSTGDNTVRVRVASSLNNRLLARGYYDRVPDIVARLSGSEKMQRTEVHSHGLLGPVRLLQES
jgi:hypothetical protein